MEHFTEDVVGKTVLADDTEVGTVTAVEGDEAVLDSATGLEAEMEEALTAGETDALSLRPEQVETVTDEEVYVRLEGTE